MGKHGGLLHSNAQSWVRLYYRRYAMLEAEEEPMVIEVPEPKKRVRIKKKIALLYPPYCDRCGTCVSLCHKRALEIKNERLWIDTELCCGCGLCAKKCPKEVLGLKEEKSAVDDQTEKAMSVESV